MKISIVISVLDAVATIERCLDSIDRQTWADRELVVMDGGSTDGTVDVLERRSAGITAWESAPDRGIYHAWNKALARVTGEWVVFLGADDWLRSPDALARMAPALASSSAPPRVVYGSVDVVDTAGRVGATVGRPWDEVRAEFRRRMAIPHQATFHHVSLFERHGRFDESFRICGDYELLLRELAAPAASARFVPGLVVVAMQSGGLSDRPASAVTIVEEFARARFMHGTTRVPAWLAGAVWRARSRRAIERTLGPRAAAAAARLYRTIGGRRDPPRG